MKNMRDENAKTATYTSLKNAINQNVENNYDYTTKIIMNDQGNINAATNEINN